jgi:hypothetical protein
VTQPDDPGPSGHPLRRRPDPLLPVVAGVATGVVVALFRHPQPGMYVVAGSLAVGALLRLLLRPRAAGLLVVRSRAVDVLVLAVLAAVVAALAVATPFPANS